MALAKVEELRMIRRNGCEYRLNAAKDYRGWIDQEILLSNAVVVKLLWDCVLVAAAPL